MDTGYSGGDTRRLRLQVCHNPPLSAPGSKSLMSDHRIKDTFSTTQNGVFSDIHDGRNVYEEDAAENGLSAGVVASESAPPFTGRFANVTPLVAYNTPGESWRVHISLRCDQHLIATILAHYIAHYPHITAMLHLRRKHLCLAC